MLRLFSLCALIGLCIVSCAKDKTDDQKIQEFIASKNLKMQQTSDGLYYSIDSVGTGTYPGATDIVSASYKLSLLDGTVIGFATPSSPDTFFLAKTIAGLQEGFQKFNRGSIGKMIIPSVLAFGIQSSGTIPPNAILYFENTKVVDFESSDENVRIKKYMAQKGWNNYQITPEGLYYIIDSIGTGTDMPTALSTVTVIYRGTLLNGTQFDANLLGYTQSLTNLIKGWQIGIPKFKKGAKGKLLIPSILGYGGQITGIIPGDSPLVFEIQLVDFH